MVEGKLNRVRTTQGTGLRIIPKFGWATTTRPRQNYEYKCLGPPSETAEATECPIASIFPVVVVG